MTEDISDFSVKSFNRLLLDSKPLRRDSLQNDSVVHFDPTTKFMNVLRNAAENDQPLYGLMHQSNTLLLLNLLISGKLKEP